MEYVITIIVLVELWYWFVLFPRMWRDESNKEVNDIKRYVEYTSRNPRR